MSAYDVLAEKVVTLPRVKGEIRLRIMRGWDGPCWGADRRNAGGCFEKIPAMSRSECASFPRSVARAAQAYLEEYKANN